MDFVASLAQRRGATSGQIALAWLLAQDASIVPIPGTRRISRLEENASASTAALSADDLDALDSLASRVGVVGARYNDYHQPLVGR